MPYRQLLLPVSNLCIPISTLVWWNASYCAKAASDRAISNRKHYPLDEGIDDCAFAITCISQENHLHPLLLSCINHHQQAGSNLGGST